MTTQNKIANEFLATYSHADSVSDSMIGNSRVLVFHISSNGQRRYTNVFIIGPRGEVKATGNEWI